jgi:Uma2 family endonuclease
MELDIPSPPRTIMEVYKMLPEGTLAELINGEICLSPAPNTSHQRLIGAFFMKLTQFVQPNGLGEIFISPYDVYLDEENNAVQPDITFVSAQNASIVKSHGIVGVPDLIVEFLSPSSNTHDLVTKKELYEKFGVKEYWIIDPSTKESIVYKLENNQYTLAGKEIATLFSPLLTHHFEF